MRDHVVCLKRVGPYGEWRIFYACKNTSQSRGTRRILGRFSQREPDANSVFDAIIFISEDDRARVGLADHPRAEVNKELVLSIMTEVRPNDETDEVAPGVKERRLRVVRGG